MPAPLAIGFAGTPEFAVTILEALDDSEHVVTRVYTQPDRPRGRGRKPKPSAVAEIAQRHGIDVATPRGKRALEAELGAAEPIDVLVVAAYGIILPPTVLAAPRFGCLNVHASLLPRWRGAAPVERAIMAGDQTTGVSIMLMDVGLDTGPVFAQREVSIDDATTGVMLTATLAELGAAALLDVLDRIGKIEPVQQDDRNACYAPMLSAADAIIDWRRDAVEIERQIRALANRQTAFAHKAGERVRVLAARPVTAASAAPPGTIRTDKRRVVVACGAGALELETVQLERGKRKPLSIRDVLNGFADFFPDGSAFDPAPDPVS